MHVGQLQGTVAGVRKMRIDNKLIQIRLNFAGINRYGQCSSSFVDHHMDFRWRTGLRTAIVDRRFIAVDLTIAARRLENEQLRQFSLFALEVFPIWQRGILIKNNAELVQSRGRSEVLWLDVSNLRTTRANIGCKTKGLIKPFSGFAALKGEA